MCDIYLNSAACKKLNEVATIECRQHANYHTYCHSLLAPLLLLLLLTNIRWNGFAIEHTHSKYCIKFNHEFLYFQMTWANITCIIHIGCCRLADGGKWERERERQSNYNGFARIATPHRTKALARLRAVHYIYSRNRVWIVNSFFSSLCICRSCEFIQPSQWIFGYFALAAMRCTAHCSMVKTCKSCNIQIYYIYVYI